MRRVGVARSSRMLDLASLALVCGGGLIYLFAYLRMDELRTRPYQEFVPAETELFARTREHSRLTRISYVGLALGGAGVIVALSAAAHARIIARRKDDVPA
jgi:hypothetical protein